MSVYNQLVVPAGSALDGRFWRSVTERLNASGYTVWFAHDESDWRQAKWVPLDPAARTPDLGRGVDLCGEIGADPSHEPPRNQARVAVTLFRGPAPDANEAFAPELWDPELGRLLRTSEHTLGLQPLHSGSMLFQFFLDFQEAATHAVGGSLYIEETGTFHAADGRDYEPHSRRSDPTAGPDRTGEPARGLRVVRNDRGYRVELKGRPVRHGDWLEVQTAPGEWSVVQVELSESDEPPTPKLRLSRESILARGLPLVPRRFGTSYQCVSAEDAVRWPTRGLVGVAFRLRERAIDPRAVLAGGLLLLAALTVLVLL